MTIYYLYVKTHNKTGLKYLGQTKQDPFVYPGSGVYWSSHLKVHGNDVSTTILQKCFSKQSLRAWGLYYSHLWSVAKSNKWANLTLEEGTGGDPGVAGREKIRNFNLGKKASAETKAKLSAIRKGKKQKKCSPEGRANIAKANKGKNLGRVWSEEVRAKIRESNKQTWARKQLMASSQ